MSDKIPQSFIQDLLSRVDIIDVIKARINLTHKGANHQALCPFHQEKSPSFSVNQQKQFYYCFGCGAHGDAINFLTQYDKLEFREAVSYLANQLGLEVPVELNNEQDNQTGPLYDVLKKATTHFEQQLRKSEQAKKYLISRGLTGQTAKHFAIGFSPDSWDQLLNAFPQSEHPSLLEAGMVIKKDKQSHRQFYDRFRNRVIFPIRDTRGRVVGFGGRSLTAEQQPKYLNSPETPVFLKHQELYGLYEARKQSKLDKLIVVEGYMDVISLYQYGINYAVATLGTAIHLRHIQKLLNYTHQIIYCFDGDNAGKKAAWKAIITTLPLLNDGVVCKILFLPQNEDPDSYVRTHGKEQFDQLVTQAKDLPHVFFEHLKKNFDIQTLSGQAGFTQEANRYIEKMPAGILKSLMIEQLSQLSAVSSDNIHRTQRDSRISQSTSQLPNRYRLPNILSPYEKVLAILLQYPKYVSLINHPDDLPIINNEKQTIRTLITLLQQQSEPSVAQLLRAWPVEDAYVQQQLATLASYPLQISEDELKAELKGAIFKIKESHRQQELNNLISKAKCKDLTLDEKKTPFTAIN